MKNRDATEPLTIYAISKLAGVSTATVSRATNAGTRHKIAPATLARVHRVVEKYGYTPNAAAKQLSGSTCTTIGIVLTHFQGLFFHDYHVQILAGVADALFETEYGLKLIMLKPTPQPRWDRYDFKAGEGVGGLLMTHWPKFFSKASVLEHLRIPCVVINDPEPDLQICCVSGDSFMGGELAARHLYAKGHRRVAVVAGPAWSCDSRLRVTGFTRFFKAAPAASHVRLVHGNYAKEQVYAEVTALFKRSRPATAMFCCNDDMALSALRARIVVIPHNGHVFRA